MAPRFDQLWRDSGFYALQDRLIGGFEVRSKDRAYHGADPRSRHASIQPAEHAAILYDVHQQAADREVQATLLERGRPERARKLQLLSVSRQVRR